MKHQKFFYFSWFYMMHICAQNDVKSKLISCEWACIA